MQLIETYKNLKELGSKTFVHAQQKRITYQELNDQIDMLTTFWGQRLKKGDRVILATDDDSAAIPLFLSLLLNGISPVLVDPKTPVARLQFIGERTQPAGFVVDAALVSDWQLSDGMVLIRISREKSGKKGRLFSKFSKRKSAEPADSKAYPALLKKQEPTTPNADLKPEDVAYVLFTSGSTSMPKGVPVTYHALEAHMKTLTGTYGLTPQSNLLNLLSLYHTDGIMQGPVLTFYAQATLFRQIEFVIDQIGAVYDTIYRDRISHFFTVPTMLSLMDKFSEGYEDSFDGGDFKLAITSSAPMPVRLWEEMEAKFGIQIANVYGLTESVAGGLYCGTEPGNRKLGTVGQPIDVEVRILNEEKQDVPTGEDGEIALKGDNIIQGYLNDTEADRHSFTDGWFLTGDMGRIDEEGFVSITGRKKNIIITGGFNVHPEEINELAMNHESVRDVATVGVPDDIWGERIVTAILLHAGHQVEETAILEFFRANLEPEKVPAQILFMDEFPRSATNKVLLPELRSLIQEPITENRGADQSTEESVLQIAARTFRCAAEQLSMASTAMTVDGWDSMAHLNLVVALEQEFDIRLTTAEIMRLQCLGDAAEIIQERKRT